MDLNQHNKMKERFNRKLAILVENKKRNSGVLSKDKYNVLIEKIKLAKLKISGKTPIEYQRLKRYDVVEVDGREMLVNCVPRGDSNMRYYVHTDEIFDIIHETHEATGHGGRCKLMKNIKRLYKNITSEEVMIYLSFCNVCRKGKRNRLLNNKSVVDPIKKSICQIGLIDMKYDGCYNHVLLYQDPRSKLVQLRPLKSNKSNEIPKLLHKIFTVFGEPNVLQTDNPEFFRAVLIKTMVMFKTKRIYVVKPPNFTFIEIAKQTIKTMLIEWLEDNPTQPWSKGLSTVQREKNKMNHEDGQCGSSAEIVSVSDEDNQTDNPLIIKDEINDEQEQSSDSAEENSTDEEMINNDRDRKNTVMDTNMRKQYMQSYYKRNRLRIRERIAARYQAKRQHILSQQSVYWQQNRNSINGNRRIRRNASSLFNGTIRDSQNLESPLETLDLEDLFPNPPVQVPADIANINLLSPLANTRQETIVKPLRIDTPSPPATLADRTKSSLLVAQSLNSPNSYYYSSSSESNFSFNVCKPKSKKRVCKLCDKYFRHRRDFIEHHKQHIRQPKIILKALTESDLKLYGVKRPKPINPIIMPSVSPSDGLKLKFKLTGTQLCEVIPNGTRERDIVVKEKENKESNDNLEAQRKEKAKIRILTAQEIKQSTSPPPLLYKDSTNWTKPATVTNQTNNINHSANLNKSLAAMEAISGRVNSPAPIKQELDMQHDKLQEKIHFECPTLDGLDQFTEETNKDAAAALLKQLLETPQITQDSEWNQTSEFISIDRLGNICTICHSTFGDEMMLYEHRRITGHEYDPALPPPRPYLNQMSQQHAMMMRPPHPQAQLQIGYGQPPVMPMEQLAQHVRNIPIHQPNHPAYGNMFHQGGPGMVRRPPPPLYRVPSPNQQQMQGGNPQMVNQARFNSMMMNAAHHPHQMQHPQQHPQHSQQHSQQHPQQHSQQHPHQMERDMYRPMGSPMNGGSLVMNINQYQAQLRQSPSNISPQNQQQINRQQVVGGHPAMARPNVPPQHQQQRPVPNQISQNLNKPNGLVQRPVFLQKRASPNSTPSPPVLSSPVNKLKPPTPNSMQNPSMAPMAKKAKIANDDDCELISMQPRADGIPTIKCVQGGVSEFESQPSPPSSTPVKETYQINDQITLTSLKKDGNNLSATTITTSATNASSSKNPKDVANILANRGITVTPSTGGNKSVPQESRVHQQSSANLPDDPDVKKIQLNSAISIISKKKSTSIDLTDEKSSGEADEKGNIDFIACEIPGCKQKFLTQDALNKHNQKGHKLLTHRTYGCKHCSAKFSTMEALSFHIRKIHRYSTTVKTTPDELGLPIVDLKNEETRAKLAAIGIVNYIPLSNLNKDSSSLFGLPIVSVQGAANTAICNLSAIGADSILSIGTVKTIPRNVETTTSNTNVLPTATSSCSQQEVLSSNSASSSPTHSSN